jgi:hypothetical protein
MTNREDEELRGLVLKVPERRVGTRSPKVCLPRQPIGYACISRNIDSFRTLAEASEACKSDQAIVPLYDGDWELES